MKSYRNIILEEARYGGLPVAHWPLDEVNGTTVRDIVGGHDGAITGGMTLGEPGPINREPSLAAGFDGTGYATVPLSPVLATSSWTVEFWMRTNLETAAWRYLMVNANSSNGGWSIYQYGKRVYSYSYSGGAGLSIWSPEVISVGQWYHVAVTYHEGAHQLYYNGILGNAKVGSAFTINTARPIYIGQRWDGVQRNDGQLAHIAMYNYALSPDRIMYHYLAGVHGVAFPLE